jgi:hypothetical protein
MFTSLFIQIGAKDEHKISKERKTQTIGPIFIAI